MRHNPPAFSRWLHPFAKTGVTPAPENDPEIDEEDEDLDEYPEDDSDPDDEGPIDEAADSGLWNEDSICDF